MEIGSPFSIFGHNDDDDDDKDKDDSVGVQQDNVQDDEYPIASWFDESQQHFVTLLGKQQNNKNQINNDDDVSALSS